VLEAFGRQLSYGGMREWVVRQRQRLLLTTKLHMPAYEKVTDLRQLFGAAPRLKELTIAERNVGIGDPLIEALAASGGLQLEVLCLQNLRISSNCWYYFVKGGKIDVGWEHGNFSCLKHLELFNLPRETFYSGDSLAEGSLYEACTDASTVAHFTSNRAAEHLQSLRLHNPAANATFLLDTLMLQRAARFCNRHDSYYDYEVCMPVLIEHGPDSAEYLAGPLAPESLEAYQHYQAMMPEHPKVSTRMKNKHILKRMW
jgi:hypothetical protein